MDSARKEPSNEASATEPTLEKASSPATYAPPKTIVVELPLLLIQLMQLAGELLAEIKVASGVVVGGVRVIVCVGGFD